MTGRNVRLHNASHRFNITEQTVTIHPPAIAEERETRYDIGDISYWQDTLYLSAGYGLTVIDTGGDIRWRFSTNNTVPGRAAVTDNTAIIGSFDEHLYALNTMTGEKEWVFDAGGAIRTSPGVVGGTVFVASDAETVYAVDANTGIMKWECTVENVVGSQIAVVDNTVYVGVGWERDGEYPIKQGFDAGEGTRVHRSELKMGNRDPETYPTRLYAINANTGEKQWSFTTGGAVAGGPTVVDGTAFFGTNGGRIYAVDATTGVEQWHIQTNDYIWSAPAVKDDVVYVSGFDQRIYAISTRTGEKQWVFDANGSPSEVVATKECVLFSASTHDTERNHVFALNATDGTIRWEFACDGWLKTPIVVNKQVIIPASRGRGGYLYALTT